MLFCINLDYNVNDNIVAIHMDLLIFVTLNIVYGTILENNNNNNNG